MEWEDNEKGAIIIAKNKEGAAKNEKEGDAENEEKKKMLLTWTITQEEN